MAMYCGVDWAEGHHDIALDDDEGRLVAKRRIEESPARLAELAAAGDNAEAPIPVAIETPRGLLVAALRATGRPIFRSTRWRWPGIGNAPGCRAARATTWTR